MNNISCNKKIISVAIKKNLVNVTADNFIGFSICIGSLFPNKHIFTVVHLKHIQLIFI